MEIITEINTNSLFDIMKTYNENIKTFCEDLENDYYLFDKVIKCLINHGFDLTYFIDSVYVRELFIITESELNEIDYINSWKLTENKYLIYGK